MVSTVLSLLAVCLLQGALSTHLETCHCEEIEQMVNASVQRAVTDLESRLSTIDTTLRNSSTNERVLQNLVESTMERLLQPIKQQLDYHLPPTTRNRECSKNFKACTLYCWLQFPI